MSTWQAVLAEYAAEANQEETVDEPYRVVVVGDSGSGKRALVSRLTDPGMRKKVAQPNGCGVSYTYTEIRTNEGALHMVELVCCDSPELLPVAIPSKDGLDRTFVLYVMDAANTSSAMRSLVEWLEEVHNQVSTLTTVEERNALIGRRQGEWSRHNEALTASRKPHLEAANVQESNGAGEGFGLSSDDVALLPSLVVVNRYDLFEKQQKVSATPKVGDMTAQQFLQQALRKVAIEARAGFVVTSAKHPASSVASLHHGLWEYVCGHLGLDLQQDSDSKSADPLAAAVMNINAGAIVDGTDFLFNNSVEDVVSLEVGQSCFLPRGFDALGYLAPQILAEMHAFGDVFRKTETPAPRVRKHEELIRELKFAAATQADSEPLAWEE